MPDLPFCPYLLLNHVLPVDGCEKPVLHHLFGVVGATPQPADTARTVTTSQGEGCPAKWPVHTEEMLLVPTAGLLTVTPQCSTQNAQDAFALRGAPTAPHTLPPRLPVRGPQHTGSPSSPQLAWQPPPQPPPAHLCLGSFFSSPASRALASGLSVRGKRISSMRMSSKRRSWSWL